MHTSVHPVKISNINSQSHELSSILYESILVSHLMKLKSEVGICSLGDTTATSMTAHSPDVSQSHSLRRVGIPV